MGVKLAAVQVGAVFQFANGPRRVVSLTEPVGNGFSVVWEYADGKVRAGRAGGEQWITYFRREAVKQIPDKWRLEVGYVELKGSGRKVPTCREPVQVSLSTKTPAKWAFVDQETGQVWSHDGKDFHRLTPAQLRELADLVEETASTAKLDQVEMAI